MAPSGGHCIARGSVFQPSTVNAGVLAQWVVLQLSLCSFRVCHCLTHLLHATSLSPAGFLPFSTLHRSWPEGAVEGSAFITKLMSSFGDLL